MFSERSWAELVFLVDAIPLEHRNEMCFTLFFVCHTCLGCIDLGARFFSFLKKIKFFGGDVNEYFLTLRASESYGCTSTRNTPLLWQSAHRRHT